MAETPENLPFSNETQASESHVKRHSRHHHGAPHAHAEGEEKGSHTAHVRHRRGHHSSVSERA